MDNFKISKKGVLNSYNGTETDIVVPGEVTKIGTYAFYMNQNITSIQISGSVTQIADSAFYGCSNLEKFLAADSKIKKIGAGTFSDCVNLKVVKLPKSVKSIDWTAFTGCASLADDDGQLIYNGVFISYYGSNTELYIKPGVHTIADNAFKSCQTIERIIIPDGVETIGAYAFCGCSNLKEVVIPTSVINIAGFAFCNCPKLADQNGCFVFNNRLCGFYGTQEDVVLPDDLQTIEPWVFNTCQTITSIAIPNSVTKIGKNAFYSCGHLSSVVLPNNLAELEEGVFGGCCSLASIILPSTLTSIGARAFYDCESLTELVIPKSVTSIGDNAFLSCKNLSKLRLAKETITLGKDVFRLCNSLDILYYESQGATNFESDETSDDDTAVNVIRIECKPEEIERICELLKESLAHFYLEGASLGADLFGKVLTEIQNDEFYCKIKVTSNIIMATIADGIDAGEMLACKLLDNNSFRNEFGSISVVGESILKKYPDADFTVNYQMLGISESVERVWTEDGKIVTEYLE